MEWGSLFLLISSGCFTIVTIIKVCEIGRFCPCLTCPKLSKIKPVQVSPLPNDGIPLADEIRLANIV